MSTNVITGERGLFLPQTELGCRNLDTEGCFPTLKRLLLLWAVLAVACCSPSCSKTSAQPRGELYFYFLSFTEGLFWAGRRAGQPGGTTAGWITASFFRPARRKFVFTFFWVYAIFLGKKKRCLGCVCCVRNLSVHGRSLGLWSRSSVNGYRSTFECFSFLFLSYTLKALLIPGWSSRAAVGSVMPEK